MTRQHMTADDTGNGPPERDHVSQVYLGLLDWGPSGNWLRRRIDWMVDQALGPRVLDAGCSEGILEVLLARRGIAVTGIDIDPDALGFARELLAKEPEEVRARVEMVEEDLIQPRLVTGLFDTVVMGQFLEYFDDPGAMLDRGLEYLRPGGRLVVTTPFGVHPREDHRRTSCLTDVIDLLKPRLGLEQLSVEDNCIRFVGRLSEDRESSWQHLDTEAVLSMTDAALVDSQAKLYEMLSIRVSRIERLQRRLQERVETDRAARHVANTSRGEIKKLEFRVKLDRMALVHLKDQIEIRTREVKARTREVRARMREVRARTRELQAMTRRLQTTVASTSFRVGSALVSAAKQPLTLWKLPFQLLRIYRSKSMPRAETVVSEGSATPHSHVPEEPYSSPEDLYLDPEPYLDPTKFMDFPVLPIPEARADGPAVAAILDTFTEYSLRHEVDLLLMSPRVWRAQLERTRPVCLLVESAWWGNKGWWRNRIVGYEELEDNPLRELLQYCRSVGIPTVFWNKEDPPHFDNFLGAAREFDFVFTSDADCVPRYREVLGHDRIYVLPFAAQPRLHNPVQGEKLAQLSRVLRRELGAE